MDEFVYQFIFYCFCIIVLNLNHRLLICSVYNFNKSFGFFLEIEKDEIWAVWKCESCSGDVDIDSSWLQGMVKLQCRGWSLGFYSSFTVEHHFTGFGQVSASLNLLTYLSALTTSMRLAFCYYASMA